MYSHIFTKRCFSAPILQFHAEWCQKKFYNFFPHITKNISCTYPKWNFCEKWYQATFCYFFAHTSKNGILVHLYCNCLMVGIEGIFTICHDSAIFKTINYSQLSHKYGQKWCFVVFVLEYILLIFCTYNLKWFIAVLEVQFS